MNRAPKAITADGFEKSSGFWTESGTNSAREPPKDVYKRQDLEYAKDPEFLIPIEKAPFHAIRLRYVWMSNGGAHIDPEAHVLDPDGNVIEGLFAAGACAHGHKSNMFNPGRRLNMAWGCLLYTSRCV